MIKIIDDNIINENMSVALRSERKRSIICFNKKEDMLQRMINCVLHDSYIRPHKHENPGKLEIFIVLKGKIGALIFDENGEVLEKHMLESGGPSYGLEIPPKTWHTFVVLSKYASLFEIIDGKYYPDTHKTHAPWSPTEDNLSEAKKYLDSLKAAFTRK